MSDPLFFLLAGIVSGALIAYLTLMVSTLYFKVPFVPTRKNVAKKMVEVAKVQKGQKIYDLGCGTGKILFLADKKGAQCTGYEGVWTVYFVGKIINFLKKQSVRLHNKNFFRANISDADTIFCYLSGPLMEKVFNEKWDELKTGTRIISNTFRIKQLVPVEIIPCDDYKIYVYEKK